MGITDPYFVTSRFGWLFGFTCRCGGEWSQWEKKTVEIHKPPDSRRVALIRNAGFRPTEADFLTDVIYQERRCTRCGRYQQETLEFL